MTEPHKPRGWTKFDELARKLAAVPKTTVDKLIAKRKRRKRRR